MRSNQNPGLSTARTDAVVTASDTFEHKLSVTATAHQSFGALWKAKDFGDALYAFSMARRPPSRRARSGIETPRHLRLAPAVSRYQEQRRHLLTAFVDTF